MFKLLVVEDEDFIRETIVTCIDWKSIGFEVEQAEDGEIAFEIAQSFRPDAVVTDIRMPFMDGLELTARLKQLYPETMVVVLSGHDEFKYAQQALSLGVVEYITKPILPSNFTQAMRNLHEKLCALHNQRASIEKLQLQLHRSLPLLRERMLNQLLRGPVSHEAITERMKFLELEITGKAFTVLLFSAQIKTDTSIETGELIQFALLNVVSEEIGDRGCCFNDMSGRLVVIFCAQDTENEDSGFIRELAEALRLSNQYALDFSITAAVGATVAALSDLYYSYETASAALQQQLLSGRDNTYYYDDYVYLEREEFRFFSQVEDLITCFHFKSGDEFVRQFEALTASMTNTNRIASLDGIRVALIDLLNGVHRVLLESGCALPSGIPTVYERIFSMNLLEDSIPILIKYFTAAKSMLADTNISRSARLIQMACKYIKQNYRDCGLSLNNAAAAVYISPVYLSTLFKKELGVTFVDYVAATRLDAAKKLLEAGGIKNYEVASRVGYSDPQYFSNCFKKYTGMTPSEYRAKRR